MIAYKGFNIDLSCLGYKFKEDTVNITSEANCRQNGFHCAEDPLDCLTYYPNWENSVYYIVDAGGDVHEDGTDSKISCTHMKLLYKLSLEEFLMESLIYISNHPLRKMNNRVVMDEAEASKGKKFTIVRGKRPIAKGELGTLLGFVKEEKRNSEVSDIAVYKVDGINYLPDTWYTVDGKPYEKQVIDE